MSGYFDQDKKESWTKAVSQPEGRQERGIGCRGTVDDGGGERGWRLIAPTKKADHWPTWRQETCLDASQEVISVHIGVYFLQKARARASLTGPPATGGGFY